MTKTEVYTLTASQMEDLIEDAVRRATEPLASKVSALQAQIDAMRPVVTHKEAARVWFASEVSPATVVRYIHEEGLPATQRGRVWYLRTQDICNWQTNQMRKAA